MMAGANFVPVIGFSLSSQYQNYNIRAEMNLDNNLIKYNQRGQP